MLGLEEIVNQIKHPDIYSRKYRNHAALTTLTTKMTSIYDHKNGYSFSECRPSLNSSSANLSLQWSYYLTKGLLQMAVKEMVIYIQNSYIQRNDYNIYISTAKQICGVDKFVQESTTAH